MARPSSAAVTAGMIGGALHVLAISIPYTQVNYAWIELQAGHMVGLFVLGVIGVGISAYTRLLVPAVGLLALVSGVLAFEFVLTPPPEWGELNGHTILQKGTLYLYFYARTWYVWLAIVLAGGIAEYGLRGGYDITADRLRNLPAFPLSRREVGWLAGGCALLFGFCIGAVMEDLGTMAPSEPFWGFVGGFLMIATVLGGILYRGLVTPLLLATPLVLLTSVDILFSFSEASGYMALPLWSPAIILVAALEWALRYRLLGGTELGRFRAESF